MSDIRKWLNIVESDPNSSPNQRPRNLSEDEFSKGNKWFHASVVPDTVGTMNDKPEFRAGDMVRISDIYGMEVGSGFGIFVAYGTSGQDCILTFNNTEIVVPVSNISAVLEQDAKDNFDELDNDGNLSPMSLGSKIRNLQESEMDERDEFSKWMKTVEEALSGKTKPGIVESSSDECGCKEWNCPTCFPDQKSAQKPPLKANVPLIDEEDNEFAQKSKPSNGVKLGDIIQKTEIRMTDGHNSPETYGGENLGAQPSPDRQVDDFEPDLEEEVPMDAGEDDFDEMEDAPNQNDVLMDENGEEITPPDDVDDVDDFDDTSQDMPPDTYSQPEMEQDEMADKIINIQAMGFSKDDQHYSRQELLRYSPEEIKQCYDKVMGDVSEADEIAEPPERPKPTKTKSKFIDPFADMGDDILNPGTPDLPANIPGADPQGGSGGADPLRLPTASRADTQRRVGAITPTDQMRDFMNRINPMAGGDEPDLLPEPVENELVVRTAQDVPAVIQTAMQATGFQTPDWHTIDNLPGYMQRNIRGMGRQIFSMFTSTPLENIQTIANVNGQGPNTDAEMRAVGGWLRDNAEDLGRVQLDHGMAIPGYEPDVKEYRANGVRFHVVRDPMGQYIYAYPDADARLGGPPGGEQGQLPGQGGRMPRLRESDFKPTIIEQIRFDEELRLAFEAVELNEAFGKPTSKERDARRQAGWQKRSDAAVAGGEEPPEAPKIDSQLARNIAGKKGGKRLIRHLHSTHKLSNEAELEPARFDQGLLWTQFKKNPHNFVIVSGQGGVAGIKPSTKYIEAMTAAKAAKGKVYNPSGDSKLPYQIIAYTNDGEQVDPALLRPPPEVDDDGEPDDTVLPVDPDPTIQKARMGKSGFGKDLLNPDNTFKLLNDQIGPIHTVWISGFSGYRGPDQKHTIGPNTGSVDTKKIAARQALKTPNELPQADSENKIFTRIRPVLNTLVHQSTSQIQSRAQRYFAGGNYEAAQKIAGLGQKLKQILVALDTNAPVTLNAGYNSPTKDLTLAIMKAIQQASGSEPGSPAYKEYASKAAKGNSMALRPILDELRTSLLGL